MQNEKLKRDIGQEILDGIHDTKAHNLGGKRLNAWRVNMMLKSDRYTYRVTWSEEDKEYVGLCAEFPSLSWLDPSPEEALKGIRQAVAQVVADMKKNGEPVPEPIAVKKYSGKFMVRVPPDLHRRLAIEAAESGVSLNRIASDKLNRQEA